MGPRGEGLSPTFFSKQFAVWLHDILKFSYYFTTEKSGPKGKKGDRGIAGEKGERGSIGEKGDKGTKGDKGDRGAAGEKGQTGDRGPPGERGSSGVSGLNSICRFFPSKTIYWFRETEQCCFYFKSTDAVMKDAGGNITGFKSYTKSKHDAKYFSGKHVTMKKIKNKKVNCLEFKNSLYKVPNVNIASFTDSYSTMIITFRTTAEIQRTREYIVSNQNNDRGISVQENRLEIWGTANDPLILQHNLEEWYTLFIQ